MADYDMEQYRNLSKEFKIHSNELIVEEELPHLRRHKQHEKIDSDNFLNSKFKISILVRPPFAKGKRIEHIQPNQRPAKTQILLYVHGIMKDPQDYKKGFIAQPLYMFRSVVRDPITTKYPFHIFLIQELAKRKDSFSDDLARGWYEDFTCGVLVTADLVIKKFKKNLEKIIQLKG